MIKLTKMPYGGDYNPEQWPEEVWEEDMRLFRQAGIDMVSVNVFGWGRIQPEEDVYDFGWLDRVLDLLQANGIRACLGTGTAVYPSWLGRRHAELQRVDFQGRKRKYGGRANFCPNSPVFRRYASALTERVAERYKDHPALAIWHVSNEYNGYCYCDNCADAFRRWLKERYGSVERVNEAWSTSFWNHLYYDWEDIVTPTETTIFWGDSKASYSGMVLDYMRFQSDSLLECYRMERAILKRITPGVPVTTNFMGYWKELDYFKWAREIDVITWDSYPEPGHTPARTAMWHDLMRGLKGGQPFLLLEQAPDHAQWMDYNVPKRPGVMRLWSYQAMARGADSVMFFQLRQSRGGGEKLHGAVIPHAGHGGTRVFREVAALGGELECLGDTLVGGVTPARIGLLFDWEIWWALELCAGPTKDLKYIDQVLKVYTAFYDQSLQVDLLHPDMDFAGYDILAAPALYMVPDGLAEKLERFTAAGGTFITTFFSGLADAHDRIVTGGYPGPLRKLLGIWVEESDILLPGVKNRVVAPQPAPAHTSQADAAHTTPEAPLLQPGEAFDCTLMCDILHTEGAEVHAVYGGDYYAGTPAVTCNRFGEGEAWYVATDADPRFMAGWVRRAVRKHGIAPVLETPVDVEAARRVKDGIAFIIVLNHAAESRTVRLNEACTDLLSGRLLCGDEELEPYGVRLLVHAETGASRVR
ncbi:beta-galactosidase [Gorillibacterium sp. sgz5001074]|uniref:beta-galactosidase n=1 Tax=Gorillibacterium sp. sgz5001074 TaxID=3446695 RepID=UPI003F66BCC3